MPALQFKKVSPSDAPTDLLLLADPSEAAIERYLLHSDCYVATFAGDVVGTFVLLRQTISTIELMNIAVNPGHQQKGWGREMLRYAIAQATASGASRMEIGTGTFGFQLAFYQREGFRVSGIVKDFFLDNYPAPVIEGGLQHFDMLRLSLDLKEK